MDALFKQKHAPLVSMLLPLLPVVVVQTYVTELIDDGGDGGFSAQEDLHVALVDGGEHAHLPL